MTTLFRLKD